MSEPNRSLPSAALHPALLNSGPATPHLVRLALVGMLASALSALVIAAEWSASFFFHPCQ